MGRSIRWSLLGWYTLILAGVLGMFTALLARSAWRITLDKVDAELRAYAEVLAAGFEEALASGGDVAVPSGGRYFRPGAPGSPYFKVSSAQGVFLAGSSSTPPEPPLHEVSVRTPAGLTVAAGRSLQAERGEFRRFLRDLLLAAGSALLLALAGGAFLVSRALAPIARISEVAAGISATSLSRRIDVSQTESELGRLARTLNETFGRLEAAFARQTRFTADASHELRTPLSILMAHAELALRKPRDAEAYRRSLETCLEASRRMKGVVEGLLLLARADAGQAALKRKPLDLHALALETVSLCEAMATGKRVSLTLQGSCVPVLGDRDRMREVLMNLVTNAIRYNRESGAVDLSLRTEGQEAVLAVADSGIGIPEKDRPHVFERFYRADQARSRELGGSGLGLAITRWIVEAHGGTIAFAAREGGGTTFTVRLPGAVEGTLPP